MQLKAIEQLTKFFVQLEVERNVSAYTLKSYHHDLDQLRVFCVTKRIDMWSSITPSHIRAHIANRHKQGISSKSLQRELSAIRSFFRYLLKHNWTNINPAQHVKAPKQARTLPKTLDVDQISGLLEAGTNSILEIRDIAMFELFYSSGIRLGELVALNIDDVDFASKLVRINAGKGGKARIVPIGSKAIVALQNWRQERRPRLESEPAFFLSNKGSRLSERSVQYRLSAWCQKKEVGQHVHPHMLRHSFASHILQASQDLRAVQELLGHSHISTTQIYTHLDFQHLVTIYDSAHPRAKKNPT
jgi:integrase/recombinase XerC